MKASGPKISRRAGRLLGRGHHAGDARLLGLGREGRHLFGQGSATPVAASASGLMEVSTVMPRVAGTSPPYSAAPSSAPRWPASIMAVPPTVCMVSMSAPWPAAERAAPRTRCRDVVFLDLKFHDIPAPGAGMSWNFQVEEPR